MQTWVGKNLDGFIVGIIVAFIQLFADSYLQFQSPKEGPPVNVHVEVVFQPAATSPPPAPRGEAAPPPPVWVSQSSEDFDIYVLSEEYRWQRGKTTVLDPDGSATSLSGELDNLVRQHGGEYGDLIAVGTASCEGGPDEEHKRAQDRADKIVIWTRNALVRAGEFRDRKIHTLNLGKYARDCSDSPLIRANPRLTDEQRRIILIACKTRERTQDLVSALHRLMKEDRPFGIHPDDYTTFVLDRWQGLP